MNLVDKNVKKETINVIGFGKTGQSIVKLLLKVKKVLANELEKPMHVNINNFKNMLGGVDNFEINIFDDKFETLRNNEFGLDVKPLKDYKHSEHNLIIVSPGININKFSNFPTVDSNSVISDIDLAYILLVESDIKFDEDFARYYAIGSKYVKQPFTIGITGTNGKTTITTFTYEVIKRKTNANIYAVGNNGNAISDIVFDSKADVLVVELSSFQLFISKYARFNSVLITNMEPDHLDYHSSLDEYYSAKVKLFTTLAFNDSKKFYGMNHTNLDWLTDTNAEPITGFGHMNICPWLYTHRIILDYRKLNQFIGKHNSFNMVVSVALAHTYNSRIIGDVTDVFINLKTPEHRLEIVDTIKGVTYINDSKSTNVDSLFVALDSGLKNVILLIGGRYKSSGLEMLVPYMNMTKEVIFFGESREKLLGFVKDGLKVPYHVCVTMKEAVELSSTLSVDGDTVLLSPGCASFDEFKDYTDRGRVFKSLVANMK